MTRIKNIATTLGLALALALIMLGAARAAPAGSAHQAVELSDGLTGDAPLGGPGNAMLAAPGGYGINQTPVIATASGANATTAANCPAIAGKTNFLAGFDAMAGGATAASLILATLTGVATGSLSYPMAIPAGATLAASPLSMRFNPPLAATAVNAAISVSMAAAGAGNTSQIVTLYCFAQ
jgi:hypothetical protein